MGKSTERWSLVAVAALSLIVPGSLADGANCQQSEGNWYCDSVNAITYNNFGASGTYDRVVDMDGCQTKPMAYSGPMAPLDEEVAVVFRGPIQLKQFAAYAPAPASKSKREVGSDHGHQHAHLHKAKRAEQVMSFTSDGSVIAFTADPETWDYGAAPTSEATQQPAPATATALQDQAAQPTASEAPTANDANSAPTAYAAPAASSSPTSPSPAPIAPGSWTQAGSYNAHAQQANGVVFLKSLYSNLTFCAADGASLAEKPEVLQDVLVPSNQEFTIWTDSKCSGQNGDCGYFNPTIPAYHGWAGTSKAFIFEFSMPHDDCTDGLAPDAPAIWLLNAQVPRTDQYGCSCWASGCGELDLFEVLTRGEERMKATLHDQKQSFGSSDFFARPCKDGTVKAAVVMHGSSVTLAMLPNNFNFGSELTQEQIQQIVSMPATVAPLPQGA